MRISKKLLLLPLFLIGAFSAPLSAYFYGSTGPSQISEGFYMGANVGTSHLSTESNVFGLATLVGQETRQFVDEYQLFGGYLWRVNSSDIVIAPHGFFEFSGHRSTYRDSLTGNASKVRMPYSFGGGSRFGIILDDVWFLYTYVGAKVTKFDFTELVDNDVLASDNTWVVGFNYGFGAEYVVWCGHRIGLSIDWTLYPEKRLDLRGVGNGTIANDFDPKTTAVRLSYIIPF